MLKNHRVFSHFTRQLALTFGLLFLSTCNYGFDNQGFGTTQAMTPFIKQFGDRTANGKFAIPSWYLSLLNSLVFIGFAAGVYIGSVVSARFGRRMTIFTMSLWALVTACICVTSKTKAQILVGRILNYIYVGMELSVIPIFQAEIMPAPIRGFSVASYQLAIAVGGVVINAICLGTSTIPSNKSWQIPTSLYVVVPTIVASLIWFVPESPRWLLLVNREEEAKRSLQKYRGASEGFDLEDDMRLLKEALEREKEQGSYRELFQGVNIKRTLIAVGSNFFLQATGQSFASAYGAVFVRQLGFINPFVMTIINSSLNAVAVIVSMSLTDRYGRRRLMLAGSTCQCVFLLIMGGMGVQTPLSNQRKIVVVAMQTLFGLSFSVGWAPQNYVVMSEVPALRLRDKTHRVASIVNVTTNFVVAFTLPYLLNAPYANLQSRVGFVYGPMAALAFVFAYFCIPDCKGKSLEEIDHLFNARVPLRHFRSATVDLHQVAKDEESSGQLPRAASPSSSNEEKLGAEQKIEKAV